MADGEGDRPEDCCLVVALPLDEAAVVAAWNNGPYADYVGRGRALRTPQALWGQQLRKSADWVRKLCEQAKGLGVAVKCDVAAPHLADILRQFRIVTLMAHWRGPGIAGDDVLVDAEAILERIESSDNAIGQSIADHLPPGWIDIVRNRPDEETRRERLAEFLVARIVAGPLLEPEDRGLRITADKTTGIRLNRDSLERWIPGAFRAGNRLELFDGLHDAHAIGALVPLSWAGTFDASNCNSSQLSHYIKQGRCDRTAICNGEETDPLERTQVVGTVYQLLAQERLSYVDARFKVAEHFAAWARETTPIKRSRLGRYLDALRALGGTKEGRA